jgi:glyoxylase-like metal-dependent hydrolase (beta-lactamase superfamily II)
MLFKQIKHRGDNFSYIIADEDTKEAAIVDPSFNTDAIIRFTKEQELHVKYIIDTHQHWDHIAGNDDLRLALNAKIVAHRLAKCFKDVDVSDDSVIKVGKVTIKVIHTPGHTPDGICLLADGKLLTGDTLFVGECGRTDLPGGSPEDMYGSLFQKLMKLDDSIEVYPGHDYGPSPQSTIGNERRNNYTLQKRTLDEFIEFMKE